MKETTNYKLKMPEVSDPLSIVPLNQNAQAIDTALRAMASAMGGKVVMACGSYTGDGAMSRTIVTAGIKPVALIMYATKYDTLTSGVSKDEVRLRLLQDEKCGFSAWCGADMDAWYWYRDDWHNPVTGETTERYYPEKTKIVFTPAMGSLTWKMETEPTADIDHSSLVNNESGVIYEWIAFGTGES